MIIKVLVKSNAPRTEILEQNKDEYKIAVSAPAESGKANQELIKFLRRKFDRDVKIVKGLTSRKKIISLN